MRMRVFPLVSTCSTSTSESNDNERKQAELRGNSILCRERRRQCVMLIRRVPWRHSSAGWRGSGVWVCSLGLLVALSPTWNSMITMHAQGHTLLANKYGRTSASQAVQGRRASLLSRWSRKNGPTREREQDRSRGDACASLLECPSGRTEAPASSPSGGEGQQSGQAGSPSPPGVAPAPGAPGVAPAPTPAGTSAAGGTPVPAKGKAYKVVMSCQPDNFVDDKCFAHFTSDAEPTGGMVNYKLSAEMKKKLVTVEADNVPGNKDKKKLLRISVDEKFGDDVGRRASVRLTTVKPLPFESFTVVDVLKMPAGLGTWPALWSNHGEAVRNDDKWPIGMEIDVMEHVNLEEEGLSTLHASPHCKMPWEGKAKPLGDEYTPWERPEKPDKGKSYGRNTNNCNWGGRYAGKNCPNAGCSTGNAAIPMGKKFNDQKGGAWAMFYNKEVTAMWFFDRADIDASFGGKIEAGHLDYLLGKKGKVQPKHKPYIIFPIKDCDVKEQYYIINLTLCGEFAGDGFKDGPGGKPLLAEDVDDGKYVISAAANEVRMANRGACEDYVLKNADCNKEWKNLNEDMMPHFDIRSFEAWDVTEAALTAEKLGKLP